MAKGVTDFSREGSNKTWYPVTVADTTTPGYWLNWKALLCYVWILASLVVASYLIRTYEGKRRPSNEEEGYRDDYGVLVYGEDTWKPCLKEIHPVWLMAYRVFAFFVLLLIIILNAIVDGGSIFYYYTDLTFTLLIIYFGLGSLLSMHGLIGFYHQRLSRQVASFWGYFFQIIYQMVAGAVVLTDCVFWFVIFPFLVGNDPLSVNLLTVIMHSINIVFLLGDAMLNSLRFPWFRIAYFILWTCFFVIFEWIIHACNTIRWPYPFLDLSSSLSPLWYLLVAFLHVPCYGIFFLVVKLKNFLLLKIFLQDG